VENTEDKGKTTDADGNQSDKITVDQAEFNQLQAAKKFHDDMVQRAADMDMEDPLEYVDAIEAIANKRVIEDTQSPDKLPEKTSEKKPETPQGMSEEDRNLIIQARMESAQAKLSSDWALYLSGQSAMKEEDRSTFDRTTLFKIIKNEGDLVAKLAPKFDGNLFAAADHILSVTDTDAKAKIRQAAANSAAAKANAASSADIGSGGRTAEAHETSPGQKAQDELKRRQDSIFPDDAPIVS